MSQIFFLLKRKNTFSNLPSAFQPLQLNYSIHTPIFINSWGEKTNRFSVAIGTLFTLSSSQVQNNCWYFLKANAT